MLLCSGPAVTHAVLTLALVTLTCRCEVFRGERRVAEELDLPQDDIPRGRPFSRALDHGLPGFRGRITQNGINYASELFVDFIMSHIQSIPFPPEKQSVAGSEVEMTNIQIVDFDRFNLKVDLLPGRGFLIEITDINANITANYSTEVSLGFWTITNRGIVLTQANNITVTVHLELSHDPTTGRPLLHRVDCVPGGNINIVFEGDMSSILNVGTSLLQDTLLSVTTTKICQTIEDKFNEEEEEIEEVAKLPVEERIGNTDFKFNFGMVQDPDITEDYVQTFHRGVTYYVNQKVEPPFQPPVIPVYRDQHQKMVYIYVTDFMVNSGLYAAQLAGKFEHNVEESLFPEELKHILRRGCDERETCLGTLFPTLASRYLHQDGSLRARLRTTGAPEINFRSGGREADFQVSGDATLFLHLGAPLQQEDELFSIQFTIRSTLGVWVNNSRVHFSVISADPRVQLVRNSAGEINSNQLGDAINSMITSLSQTVFEPHLQEIGAQGFALPRTEYVELTNTEIIPVEEEGIFLVSSDFDISIPCNLTVGPVTSLSDSIYCSNGRGQPRPQGTPALTPTRSGQQRRTDEQEGQTELEPVSSEETEVTTRRRKGRRRNRTTTPMIMQPTGDASTERPLTKQEIRERRRQVKLMKKAAKEERRRQREERKRRKKLEREQKRREERERRRRERRREGRREQ